MRIERMLKNMGYCIDLQCGKFIIKKKYASEVVEALHDFAKNFTNDYNNNEMMWVNKNMLVKAETIEDCFKDIRYPLKFNKNGDFTIDYFLGEKRGDDLEIFNSIARYVEPNSFIEFQGEDGDVFRYVFDGETCEYEFIENVDSED